MTPAKFLEIRGPAWDRLEEILRAAGRRGPAGLSEETLHELARLYPGVAVDVARARLLGLDDRTRGRLNQLAIGAHGLLYRRRHRRPLQAARRFFAWEYPRLFRHLWAYIVLATVVMGVPAVAAYVAVRMRPATAYVLMPAGLDADEADEVTAGDVSERYRRIPKPLMDSFITTNNISVAFNAFALGIFVGIGTAYVLVINGVMLGTFFGHFANHGLTYTSCSFIIPHGALEIFAIVVSAGAGLRLGLSLAAPGRLTRRASLRQGAREAVRLVLGTIPMFVVAGAIESVITPSHLPGPAKIAIGVLTLAGTLAYLLGMGRHGPAVGQPTTAGPVTTGASP